MNFNRELAAMSREVEQTRSGYRYLMREVISHRDTVITENLAGNPGNISVPLCETDTAPLRDAEISRGDAETAKEVSGDGTYESQIMPGLVFFKYRHDVQYNGVFAKLTPTQYRILDLLNDFDGQSNIHYIGNECSKFGKVISPEGVKKVISELNSSLSNIGIPRSATINYETVTF
jgi:hypothetical protein